MAPCCTNRTRRAVGALVDRLPSTVRLLHLHVNDWLFADQQAGADQRIAALAHRLKRRGMTLTVTLHDLPQVSDGPVLFRRRANTYRAIVRQTGGVVVSSRHERALLLDALADGPGMDHQRAAPGTEDTDVDVIPLPIDSRRAGCPRRALARTRCRPSGSSAISIRARAIARCWRSWPECGPPSPCWPSADRRNGTPSCCRNCGPSPNDGGIGFRCTGYVSDADVVQELRGVLVPLAPHTHVSASGSINSWIAAGRRPLVPAGRYVGELADRLPGSVCVYRPGELRQAVDRAIANPESTWLPAGFRAGPTTVEVASRYLAWLRRRAFTRP